MKIFFYTISERYTKWIARAGNLPYALEITYDDFRFAVAIIHNLPVAVNGQQEVVCL